MDNVFEKAVLEKHRQFYMYVTLCLCGLHRYNFIIGYKASCDIDPLIVIHKLIVAFLDKFSIVYQYKTSIYYR